MDDVIQRGQLVGSIVPRGQLIGSITPQGSLVGSVSEPKMIGGTHFTTDETLTLKDGVLSVNTAKEVKKGNELPVTSDAVHQEFEIIAALFETI